MVRHFFVFYINTLYPAVLGEEILFYPPLTFSTGPRSSQWEPRHAYLYLCLGRVTFCVLGIIFISKSKHTMSDDICTVARQNYVTN